MPRIRRFLAPLLAMLVVTVTMTAGAASAQELDDAPAEPPAGEDAGEEFGETADTVAVMVADSRFNGIRLPEELVFAFAYDEQFPHESSLWLQISEENDIWLPLCVGWLIGDDETVVFVGGSLWGDEEDGCVMGMIGEDASVFFSAIELKGDAVLTSAMYLVG